jgi:hypothetical protein
MTDQPTDDLGFVDPCTIPDRMHFDARALLAHVVTDAPDHRAGEIDRQCRTFIDPAHIGQISRPLIAVLELQILDSEFGVLAIGFDGDAQPFVSFEKDFLVSDSGLIETRWDSWQIAP